MKRHYEIEGVLYPASDWANWARLNIHGVFIESPKRINGSQVPATTELDRFCLRIYGEMFDTLGTDLQRVLEDLHRKGGLMV